MMSSVPSGWSVSSTENLKMARRISDVYIVESLVQSTEAHPEPLRWHERGGRGYATLAYVAQVGPVRIELNDVPETTGSRLCLTLTYEEDKVSVEEPYPVGIFGRNHKSEDDCRLARAIRHLRSSVIQQCRLRAARAASDHESIRERIFRQLLFSTPGLQREA